MVIFPAIVKQCLLTDWFFSMCFWWKFSNHVHVSCRSPCIIQSGNSTKCDWKLHSISINNQFSEISLWGEGEALSRFAKWEWSMLLNVHFLSVCFLFWLWRLFLGWFNFYLLGGRVALRWLKEEAIQCMKEADWPLIFRISPIWQYDWLEWFVPTPLFWILRISLVSPQWCKRKQVRIVLTY